jgi:hypothetical protein
MTYKNITTFAFLVAFMFALGFLFMPARLTSIYNVTLNEGGVLISQFFSAPSGNGQCQGLVKMISHVLLSSSVDLWV